MSTSRIIWWSSVRFEVRVALFVSLLVIIAMWTYQGTTGNSFVWDSIGYLYIYEEHLSSLSQENIMWMATSLDFYNWHPLTWLSWAIDYQLYGGLVPWGYHFSNNLLHATNGVLVFALILANFRILKLESTSPLIGNNNHALLAAFLASLLFVVHPLHVESVAWVAQRKDLLCQSFLLLALLTYVKYSTCEHLIKTRWYLITMGLFFLAVLSKPMAVTFPVVLLLVDIYPLQRTGLTPSFDNPIRKRSFYYLILEKVPFFLISLGLVWATLMAQRISVANMTFLARAVNAVHSIVLYIEKLIFPLNLAPHYPYFVVEGGDRILEAILEVFVFSGITLAAILAWRKKKRGWLIAWLFYLLTLVPVLGIVQVGLQGGADRYTYLPLLSFYMLVAFGIFAVLQRGNSFRKILLLLFVSVVILLFIAQTKKQIRVWQNELSVWSQAVKIYPDNIFARERLGYSFKRDGDFDNALIQFEASHELIPNRLTMLAGRGITFMYLGRYKDAITDLVALGATLKTRSDLIVDTNCIQYNIGWNFARLEMYQEAIDLFERVDQTSASGPDAVIWLDELMSFNPQSSKAALSDGLPGVCDELISSKYLAPHL